MNTDALNLFDTTMERLGELKAVAALVGDGFDQSDDRLCTVFYMIEKGLERAIEDLHQLHELSRLETAEAPATA